MTTQNPTISITRGLAICLVIAGHIIQQSMVLAGSDFFLNPIFKVIYIFHMPLFFFINGYLLGSSLERKKPWDLLRSRFQAILVPCISWGIVGIGAITLFSFMKSGQSISLEQGAQILSNASSAWFIWFLFSLFFVNALILLSAGLDKNLKAGAYIFGYALAWFFPFRNWFQWYYVVWFYPFCLAGLMVFRRRLNQKLFLRSPWVTGFLLLAFALLAGIWDKADYIYIHKMAGVPVGPLLYRYLGGFAGIGLAFVLGNWLVDTRLGQGLSAVGTNSLAIYLIQRIVVEAGFPFVARIFGVRFHPDSLGYDLLFIPIATVFFVVVCGWLSKVVLGKSSVVDRLFFGKLYQAGS